MAAEPHKQPAMSGFHTSEGHAKLHHWYQRLMRPDMPAVSCCSSFDCAVTQAKLVNGEWHAMKAGRWIRIPPEKINKDESYDSMAHICWLPSTVNDDSILCFVKPGAGI